MDFVTVLGRLWESYAFQGGLIPRILNGMDKTSPPVNAPQRLLEEETRMSHLDSPGGVMPNMKPWTTRALDEVYKHPVETAGAALAATGLAALGAKAYLAKSAATIALKAEGVTIVPLTKENLPKAIAAAKDGFHYGWPVLNPAKDFRASLDPIKNAARVSFDPKVEMNARYWVAMDNQGRVVGTTGLYETMQDQGKAYWLGWMSVPRAYQGQGIGKKLVDFSVEEAQKDGREYLRLYTSTSRGESAAQMLYERQGFKIMGREPHSLPRIIQKIGGEKEPLEILFREKPIKIP